MFYNAVFCITGGTETLKYIVRKAINSFLPKEIIWRNNKLGFAVPQKTWQNYYKNENLEEIKES